MKFYPLPLILILSIDTAIVSVLCMQPFLGGCFTADILDFLQFFFLPPLPPCPLSHRCRRHDVDVSVGVGTTMICQSLFCIQLGF